MFERHRLRKTLKKMDKRIDRLNAQFKLGKPQFDVGNYLQKYIIEENDKMKKYKFESKFNIGDDVMVSWSRVDYFTINEIRFNNVGYPMYCFEGIDFISNESELTLCKEPTYDMVLTDLTKQQYKAIKKYIEIK